MGQPPKSNISRWSMLVLILGSMLTIGAFTYYYITSDDIAPDSPMGYAYAIIGTIFLLLTATLYSLTRKNRKRALGALQAALRWHICFGGLALILLLLHSFGNFNPRSGTYALYGLLALVVSGMVGRTLDRIAPRMIAQEASKALTWQGEDRIEAITAQMYILSQSQRLQHVAMPGTTHSHTFYQENTIAPESQAALQELQQELHNIRQAMKREIYYRALVRYWRVIHVILVWVTIGLMIWHLVYAAQLLLPTLLH